MLITGFELRTSTVRTDRSTNWATISTLTYTESLRRSFITPLTRLYKLPHPIFWSKRWMPTGDMKSDQAWRGSKQASSVTRWQDCFCLGWEPWSNGYGKRLTGRRLWVRILAPYTGWTIFTDNCCKNCNDVCLKRPKINEKEAAVDPFKKDCFCSIFGHRQKWKFAN